VKLTGLSSVLVDKSCCRFEIAEVVLIVILKTLAANSVFGTAVCIKHTLNHALLPAWQGKEVLKNYTANPEISI